MGTGVYNIAKGRGSQWLDEIRQTANFSNTGYANSAIIVSLWRRGTLTDDQLNNFDDIAAQEADAQAAELTSGVNANYARKTIIDTTPTITIDDTANTVSSDIPDQTWTALGAGGTAITDFVTAFDPDTTAGTDSTLRPWTFHAFAVTPDGSDVTAQIATAGFYQAA